MKHLHIPDHLPAIVRPVIDAVVEAVVNSPIVESPVTRRQVIDPVTVVVRMVTPEVSRTIIGKEVALPRRDPMDIPVLADPHEIIPGFTHHVVSGARHVLVVGGESVPGGIADPLGLLPSGIVSSAAGGAAPGRRSDRLGYPLGRTPGRGSRASGGGGGTSGRRTGIHLRTGNRRGTPGTAAGRRTSGGRG